MARKLKSVAGSMPPASVMEDAALAYVERGWAIHPVDPRTKAACADWKTMAKLTTETVATRFGGNRVTNIGVKLGAASNGLTDADADSPEAIKLAPYFLPTTDAIFGRESKPSSHWLYYTDLHLTEPKGVLQFKDLDGRMICELRFGSSGEQDENGETHNNAQTVIPPSVHESGQSVGWVQEGDPARCDAEVLKQRFKRWGLASLFLMAWPEEGGRHHAAFTIGGNLARVGWSEEEASHFVGAISTAAGDKEVDVRDFRRAARDAVRSFHDDKPTPGLPKLTEQFGEKFARRFAEELGLEPPVRIEFPAFRWESPANIPRRRWVYGKHYQRRVLSSTTAPGGVGKSSLMIVEALAITTGRDLLNVQPDESTKVALWNGEETMEELRRRITAAALHYQVPSSEFDDRLFVANASTARIVVAEQSKGGMKINRPMIDAVKHFIAENDIGVLSIDPFIKSHHVNENDNMAIDLVATEWSRVADETNCAIELVHHTRKLLRGGEQERSVEDGRGASALLAAVRSARVLGNMTADEADAYDIPETRRRFYFRADNGKSNMSPPADSASWFENLSVMIPNGPEGSPGDNVGVTVFWMPPDFAEEVSNRDIEAAQALIAQGGPFRENSQAADWIGYPIAKALFLDVERKGHRNRIKKLVSLWLELGYLVSYEDLDQRRKPKKFIKVGAKATDKRKF